MVSASLLGCHWFAVKDGDPRARAMLQRHYSRRCYKDGRRTVKIAGPGEYMMLLTVDSRAVFLWRKFIDKSGQTGVNCALFRNEGFICSSELINEADGLAWSRWPGERLYTYVNPRKIKSVNPGCCFKHAGWQLCGQTKGGLVILEKLPPVLQSLSNVLNVERD